MTNVSLINIVMPKIQAALSRHSSPDRMENPKRKQQCVQSDSDLDDYDYKKQVGKLSRSKCRNIKNTDVRSLKSFKRCQSVGVKRQAIVPKNLDKLIIWNKKQKVEDDQSIQAPSRLNNSHNLKVLKMQYKMTNQESDKRLLFGNTKSQFFRTNTGNSRLMTPSQRIDKNTNKKFYVTHTGKKVQRGTQTVQEKENLAKMSSNASIITLKLEEEDNNYPNKKSNRFANFYSSQRHKKVNQKQLRKTDGTSSPICKQIMVKTREQFYKTYLKKYTQQIKDSSDRKLQFQTPLKRSTTNLSFSNIRDNSVKQQPLGIFSISNLKQAPMKPCAVKKPKIDTRSRKSKGLLNFLVQNIVFNGEDNDDDYGDNDQNDQDSLYPKINTQSTQSIILQDSTKNEDTCSQDKAKTNPRRNIILQDCDNMQNSQQQHKFENCQTKPSKLDTLQQDSKQQIGSHCSSPSVIQVNKISRYNRQQKAQYSQKQNIKSPFQKSSSNRTFFTPKQASVYFSNKRFKDRAPKMNSSNSEKRSLLLSDTSSNKPPTQNQQRFFNNNYSTCQQYVHVYQPNFSSNVFQLQQQKILLQRPSTSSLYNNFMNRRSSSKISNNTSGGFKIFSQPNDALGMLKLFANQQKAKFKNVTFLKGNALGVRRNSTGIKQ